MLDLTQHLITFTDLSVLPHTAIASSNLHFDVSNIHAHINHAHINMDLLAQQFNQDVMGDIGKGWKRFVDSGQIWALGIGVVVGYLFRSITSA